MLSQLFIFCGSISVNQSIATTRRVFKNCLTHLFASVMPFSLQIISHVLQCQMRSTVPSPSNFGRFSFGPTMTIGLYKWALFGPVTLALLTPTPWLCAPTPTICIPTPVICSPTSAVCSPTPAVSPAVNLGEEVFSKVVAYKSVSKTKSSLHVHALSALRAVRVDSLLSGFSSLGEYKFKNSSLASSTNSTRWRVSSNNSLALLFSLKTF